MLQVKNDTAKTEIIRLRVTEQEKQLIKDMAAKKGVSMTDFIKTCINECLAQENKR